MSLDGTPIRTRRRAPAARAIALLTAVAVGTAGIAPAHAQDSAMRGMPIIRDAEIEQLLRDYAQPVLRAAGLAKQNVRVVVLSDRSFNAFVMDGRHIFINAGALFDAKTPNEIIGVLAHETAHAAARHGARLTKRSTIAGILFQAAQIGAIIATGGAVGLGTYYALQYGFFGLGMILNLSLLGVSRDYEAEADQLGAQYAWRAGYDPKGFITFFDKMASEEGYAKSASFFRTHPPFLERILSTFSEITYLPRGKDLLMDSSAFVGAKQRVAELIRKREQEVKDNPSLRGESPECRR